MNCDSCGQNEAVIHLTQIVDNEMATHHLCEPCAAEKGLDAGTGGEAQPLADFIAQMGKGLADEAAAGTDACSYCGHTLEQFKKTGRLGCSHCYVTFAPQLKPLLRRIHGGTQHLGKVYLPPDPSKAEKQERLAGLRRRLAKAVDSEDFERAAKLRDQIHSLEASV